MKATIGSIVFVLLLCAVCSYSQILSDKDVAAAEALFKKANDLLEQKKFFEALSKYQALLKILPDDPAVLYNGGFAAMLGGDDATAVDLWAKLKQADPEDWQVRAKLIQSYQRLNKINERDKERADLLSLWKGKKNKDLSEQIEYCRDRFKAGGRDILAFELFELKGPRGMRYVFSVMDDAGKEDYRISLGSYDLDNTLWHEMTKPTPPKDQRLFHLDGYFKDGGHATYGMMVGEPTYEATKTMVMDILEKKAKPMSATIPSKP